MSRSKKDIEQNYDNVLYESTESGQTWGVEIDALQSLVEDAPIEAPKVVEQPVEVRLLDYSAVEKDGVQYASVVTVHEPLKAFLIPSDTIENTRVPQTIILTEGVYQEAYDWSKELEVMYPDIETIRKNALLSFWRAGALDHEDLNKHAIRSKMLGSAYPYRLP